MLEGEGRRRPGPGRRGGHDAGGRRQRDVGRAGAAKVFVLGGGRLRQGAAVGVVGAALWLEMRQARARIVARQMEGGGIGDRKAQRAGQEEADEEGRAEPNRKARHGMECAEVVPAGQGRPGSGAPAGVPPCGASGCGRAPSSLHPRRSCRRSSRTSRRGWWGKRSPPGCSSRARRAGHSGAARPA